METFSTHLKEVLVSNLSQKTHKFLEMTNFLVENHPTTLEFYAAREAEMTVENSETLDKAEVDELFDIIQEQELLKTSQSKLKCPPLEAVARDHLCIQVTSASSERMFSTGGNIISAKRECIKPETIKMLVFIKENYSQVKANIKYWVKNCNDEPGAPPTPVEIPEPTETQAKTQLPSTPRASSQEPQAGGSGLKKNPFTQAKKGLTLRLLHVHQPEKS